MDQATQFKLINELITAISTVLWPIVTVFVVLLFKRDIAALLGRMRKGTFFGQEFELDPTVKEFRRVVEEAKQEIPTMPLDKERLERETGELADDISDVLKAAYADPELGILKLSIMLEREVRFLAGAVGHLEMRRRMSVVELLTYLVERGFLPKHTAQSIRIFWDLRNQIIHGQDKVESRSVVKVLDIGLELLKTIRTIPQEINVVYHPGVDVFSDSECKNTRKDVKGIILQTTSTETRSVSKRIFPTTNVSYYQKGKRVTWEWDLTKTWGQTWYIDPDSNEKKKAWDSAGEFVGRHMDEIQ